MSNISPRLYRRRSPVYRKFEGAHYVLAAGEAQVARGAARSGAPALFDFSLMPRVGVRGAAAGEYLAQRGMALPDSVNRAVCGAPGRWVARVGKSEFWVLGVSREAAFPADMSGLDLPRPGCYPVPCEEGRAWFLLRHPQRARVMAKLCGVDLREDAFPSGSIAQTSVARVNAVVIHHEVFGQASFSILSDNASAEYLWDAFCDALREFDGVAGGLDDLD